MNPAALAPDAALASAIKVEVDGQPLDGAAETALVRVAVDDHLHLPDTFELTFQETAEMTVAEAARLRVGCGVKVSTSAMGDAAPSLLVSGEVGAQIEQVFRNLAAVAKAAGGSLADVVKLNVFLTDLKNFPLVNETMARHFNEPYPARAAIGVAALPRGGQVEMDAVMVLAGSNKKKAQRRGAEAQRKAKARAKKKKR